MRCCYLKLYFMRLQEYCLVRPHTAQTGASGPRSGSADVKAEPDMVSSSSKIAETGTPCAVICNELSLGPSRQFRGYHLDRQLRFQDRRIANSSTGNRSKKSHTCQGSSDSARWEFAQQHTWYGRLWQRQRLLQLTVNRPCPSSVLLTIMAMRQR